MLIELNTIKSDSSRSQETDQKVWVEADSVLVIENSDRLSPYPACRIFTSNQRTYLLNMSCEEAAELIHANRSKSNG